MQISYHVQFVLLDLSGNVWQDFRGLWQSWSPTTVHAFFSTSFLCLHCAMLCLCPQARTRTFLLGRCCPPSVWPPSPATSCSFSPCYCQQSLVVITPVLGWLHSYQCLRHAINISPLSSIGTHYWGLKSDFMFRKVCWVNLYYFWCATSLENLYKYTSLFSQVVSCRTSVSLKMQFCLGIQHREPYYCQW